VYSQQPDSNSSSITKLPFDIVLGDYLSNENYARGNCTFYRRSGNQRCEVYSFRGFHVGLSDTGQVFYLGFNSGDRLPIQWNKLGLRLQSGVTNQGTSEEELLEILENIGIGQINRKEVDNPRMNMYVEYLFQIESLQFEFRSSKKSGFYFVRISEGY
jgi:hypothetical protein